MSETTAKSVIDLCSFTSDKANIPSDVVIVHPVTQEPTDIVISVVGSDSTAAQECVDRQQARRIRQMRTSENPTEFDPNEIREDTMELLVACTTGWKNVVFRGKELEFTPENVRLVYESVPAIREQISKATGSRARFYKP